MSNVSTIKPQLQEIKAKFVELVNKAATNPTFKKTLQQNVKKVLEECGVVIDPSITIKVVENNDNTHHIIVPKQPVSQERQLSNLPNNPTFTQIALFIITQIQRNSEHKSQLLSDPAKVLHQYQVNLPNNAQVIVHQNTDQVFYVVIPHTFNNSKEHTTQLTEIEIQDIATALSRGSEKGQPQSNNKNTTPNKHDYQEGQTHSQTQGRQGNYQQTPHESNQWSQNNQRGGPFSQQGQPESHASGQEKNKNPKGQPGNNSFGNSGSPNNKK